MQWGEHLQFFLDIQEETGETPTALQSRPDLDEGDYDIWSGYAMLARNSAQGGVIPLAEIDAFCNLFGVEDRDTWAKLMIGLQQAEHAAVLAKKARADDSTEQLNTTLGVKPVMKV